MQSSCAGVNSPYKRKCLTNSGDYTLSKRRGSALSLVAWQGLAALRRLRLLEGDLVAPDVPRHPHSSYVGVLQEIIASSQ